MSLLDEYVERFDQSFPFRMIPSGQNIDDILKECLEKGEPYKVEYKDDMDY